MAPSLEEVLQAEVEVLASELHDAEEEEGVAAEVLGELELGVERAAEMTDERGQTKVE